MATGVIANSKFKGHVLKKWEQEHLVIDMQGTWGQGQEHLGWGTASLQQRGMGQVGFVQNCILTLAQGERLESVRKSKSPMHPGTCCWCRRKRKMKPYFRDQAARKAGMGFWLPERAQNQAVTKQTRAGMSWRSEDGVAVAQELHIPSPQQ